MGRHNNGFAQARSQDDQSWYDIKTYPHTATQQLPIAVHAKQYYGADTTTGSTTVNVYSDSTCQTIIWQGVFWQPGTMPLIDVTGSTTVVWDGGSQSPTTTQISSYFEAEIVVGKSDSMTGTTKLKVEFFGYGGVDPDTGEEIKPIEYVDPTQYQQDMTPSRTYSEFISEDTSYNLEAGAQYFLNMGPLDIPTGTKWVRISFDPNPWYDGIPTHGG